MEKTNDIVTKCKRLYNKVFNNSLHNYINIKSYETHEVEVIFDVCSFRINYPHGNSVTIHNVYNDLHQLLKQNFRFRYTRLHIDYDNNIKHKYRLVMKLDNTYTVASIQKNIVNVTLLFIDDYELKMNKVI